MAPPSLEMDWKQGERLTRREDERETWGELVTIYIFTLHFTLVLMCLFQMMAHIELLYFEWNSALFSSGLFHWHLSRSHPVEGERIDRCFRLSSSWIHGRCSFCTTSLTLLVKKEALFLHNKCYERSSEWSLKQKNNNGRSLNKTLIEQWKLIMVREEPVR